MTSPAQTTRPVYTTSPVAALVSRLDLTLTDSLEIS
jgi:hypothetical protein